MSAFFSSLFFTIFLSINLFSNDSFYTISICSNLSYKDALYCKNNILREELYDIIITKEKNTQYRTNYGIFSSIEEARENMAKLNPNLQKFHPFVLKINNKISDFELYEIYTKNEKVKTVKKVETDSKEEISKQEINRKENTKENIKEKIAYLTFDDGPLRATKNIFEVLKEENIPATMFFIGYQIENFNQIYKEALTYENLTIANHTYSHANNRYKKFYSNPDLVVDDIIKANSIIKDDRKSKTSSKYLPVRLAGRNVFRLPNIEKNDNMIEINQRETEILGYNGIFNEGYYIYGWDSEWKYTLNGQPIETPEEIYLKMEKIHRNNLSLKDNKVVLLMHDFMFLDKYNGKENLRILIKLLKENGWSFDNIENY